LPTFANGTVFQRDVSTFNLLPEGIAYPLEQLGEGIGISLQDICKRVDSLTGRGHLLTTPLKKLKVEIKIQKATASFKNNQRFIFYLETSPLFTLSPPPPFRIIKTSLLRNMYNYILYKLYLLYFYTCFHHIVFMKMEESEADLMKLAQLGRSSYILYFPSTKQN
jgi:hypothetical protein